jgi:hypothetical protein
VQRADIDADESPGGGLAGCEERQLRGIATAARSADFTAAVLGTMHRNGAAFDILSPVFGHSKVGYRSLREWARVVLGRVSRLTEFEIQALLASVLPQEVAMEIYDTTKPGSLEFSPWMPGAEAAGDGVLQVAGRRRLF